MALLATAFPVLPGKIGALLGYIEEINGLRRAEFVASRRAFGVHERTFLQQTPGGDLVISTLEGDDPFRSFMGLISRQDEFTAWFNIWAAEVHGVDLFDPPAAGSPSVMIADSGPAAFPKGALFAIGVPIGPGQIEAHDHFLAELNGPRKAQFAASRAALGVRERSFRQPTPDGGAFAVLTLEGANPAVAFTNFGSGTDEFTEWFVANVLALHGVDLRRPRPGPLPRLVVES